MDKNYVLVVVCNGYITVLGEKENYTMEDAKNRMKEILDTQICSYCSSPSDGDETLRVIPLHSIICFEIITLEKLKENQDNAQRERNKKKVIE